MCMFAYMYMCTRVCTYCGWMYGSTEVYTYICIYIVYTDKVYTVHTVYNGIHCKYCISLFTSS